MKSFFSTVLNALLWAVMALLIFMVLSGIVQRYFGRSSNGLFGIGYAVVVSGSMEPNIHVDDMIIYHEHPAKDYQVGDVIVYRRNTGTPEEMLITHRIVEIREDGSMLTTRGDANKISDPEISFDDVVGRLVWRIPRFGFIVEYIKKPWGIVIAALLLAALIAGNLLAATGTIGRKKVKTRFGEQYLKY